MPEVLFCNPSTSMFNIEESFPQPENWGIASIEEQNLKIPLGMIERCKQSLLGRNPFSNDKEISYKYRIIIPSDRPFNKLMDDKQEERKRLIDRIKDIPHSYAERLHTRIKFLNKAAEEEYLNEELISSNSLEGFLNFMTRKERYKYPDTTITPDGNIRIQWQ